MKKRTEKIVLIIFFMIIIMITYIIIGGKATKTEQYADYQFKIENAIYNPMTRTGYMDLEVKYTKFGVEKLFQTSDDLLKNGKKEIVDNKYLLRVCQDDVTFLTKAEEVSNSRKKQVLRVYFLNETMQYTESPFYLNISKEILDNVEASLDMNAQINQEFFRFSDGVNIIISSTGIIMDATSSAYYDRNFSGIVSMKLVWSDRSEILMFTNYMTNEKKLDNAEVHIPKLILNEGDSYRYRVYAYKSDDWENIQSIQIGNRVIYRGLKEKNESAENISSNAAEQYKNILTDEEIKEYDTGISYADILNNPSNYEIDSKMILTGVIETIRKDGKYYIISLQTQDGKAMLNYEITDEDVKLYKGNKCVACVCYRDKSAGEEAWFKAVVVKRL